MRLVQGPLTINMRSLSFNEYFTGVVRRGYGASARVNLPKSMEGKRVLLVVLPDDPAPVSSMKDGEPNASP